MAPYRERHTACFGCDIALEPFVIECPYLHSTEGPHDRWRSYRSLAYLACHQCLGGFLPTFASVLPVSVAQVTSDPRVQKLIVDDDSLRMAMTQRPENAARAALVQLYTPGDSGLAAVNAIWAADDSEYGRDLPELHAGWPLSARADACVLLTETRSSLDVARPLLGGTSGRTAAYPLGWVPGPLLKDHLETAQWMASVPVGGRSIYRRS